MVIRSGKVTNKEIRVFWFRVSKCYQSTKLVAQFTRGNHPIQPLIMILPTFLMQCLFCHQSKYLGEAIEIQETMCVDNDRITPRAIPCNKSILCRLSGFDSSECKKLRDIFKAGLHTVHTPMSTLPCILKVINQVCLCLNSCRLSRRSHPLYSHNKVVVGQLKLTDKGTCTLEEIDLKRITLFNNAVLLWMMNSIKWRTWREVVMLLIWDDLVEKMTTGMEEDRTLITKYPIFWTMLQVYLRGHQTVRVY